MLPTDSEIRTLRLKGLYRDILEDTPTTHHDAAS